MKILWSYLASLGLTPLFRIRGAEQGYRAKEQRRGSARITLIICTPVASSFWDGCGVESELSLSCLGFGSFREEYQNPPWVLPKCQQPITKLLPQSVPGLIKARLRCYQHVTNLLPKCYQKSIRAL